jgi:hypothetical protein
MDHKYHDDEMGMHNNFDILALCDLVEDYRIEIVNASEELSILATELTGAHVVIEAHKKDLVVSNALIVELEESICVLDDELVDMRDFVVTIVTLLSVQASDTDVVDGLRSILRIDRDALGSDTTIEEIGQKAKLPGGEKAVINRYKDVITSQLSEITALKERIRLLDPNSDKGALNHPKECSPAQECINSFEGRVEKKGILKLLISAPTGARTTRYYEPDDGGDKVVGVSGGEEGNINSDVSQSQRTFPADSSSSDSQNKNISATDSNGSKETAENTTAINCPDIRAQDKTDKGGSDYTGGLTADDCINISDVEKRRVKLKEREMRSSTEGERSKERRVSKDDKNVYMQLEIDRDNAWRQEDIIDISGPPGIMRSHRKGSRGNSAVDIALNRARANMIKGQMGYGSESKKTEAASNILNRSHNYNDEIFNSIRSKNLSSLSILAPEQNDVRTQEQQYLHDVWLGTAENSPPKKRDEKSPSFDDTASLSEPSSNRSSSNSSVTNTVRFSRPIQFSHPVLRSDCDGTFFDKDDLRHSDSRNFSHNSDYSRTNNADISKIVSETLNKESNRDIIRRKTRL